MNRGVCKAERRKAVIGAITGQFKALTRLAPHPASPSYTGPVLIKNNSAFKPQQDIDALPGQLFLESFLAPVFEQAATDTPYSFAGFYDVDKIADTASQILEDRYPLIPQEGQGSLARCKHNALAKGFHYHDGKQPPLHDALMDAFYADRPQREKIEKNIAFLYRQFDQLAIQPGS